MKYFNIALFFLFCYSCHKASEVPDNQEIVENTATIQSWRYSCGSACEAAAWVLVLDQGEPFEIKELPNNYRVQDKKVVVKFQKTGKRSQPNNGTGLEQIILLKITDK